MDTLSLLDKGILDIFNKKIENVHTSLNELTLLDKLNQDHYMSYAVIHRLLIRFLEGYESGSNFNYSLTKSATTYFIGKLSFYAKKMTFQQADALLKIHNIYSIDSVLLVIESLKKNTKILHRLGVNETKSLINILIKSNAGPVPWTHNYKNLIIGIISEIIMISLPMYKDQIPSLSFLQIFGKLLQCGTPHDKQGLKEPVEVLFQHIPRDHVLQYIFNQLKTFTIDQTNFNAFWMIHLFSEFEGTIELIKEQKKVIKSLLISYVAKFGIAASVYPVEVFFKIFPEPLDETTYILLHLPTHIDTITHPTFDLIVKILPYTRVLKSFIPFLHAEDTNVQLKYLHLFLREIPKFNPGHSKFDVIPNLMLIAAIHKRFSLDPIKEHQRLLRNIINGLLSFWDGISVDFFSGVIRPSYPESVDLISLIKDIIQVYNFHKNYKLFEMAMMVLFNQIYKRELPVSNQEILELYSNFILVENRDEMIKLLKTFKINLNSQTFIHNELAQLLIDTFVFIESIPQKANEILIVNHLEDFYHQLSLKTLFLYEVNVIEEYQLKYKLMDLSKILKRIQFGLKDTIWDKLSILSKRYKDIMKTNEFAFNSFLSGLKLLPIKKWNEIHEKKSEFLKIFKTILVELYNHSEKGMSFELLVKEMLVVQNPNVSFKNIQFLVMIDQSGPCTEYSSVSLHSAIQSQFDLLFLDKLTLEYYFNSYPDEILHPFWVSKMNINDSTLLIYNHSSGVNKNVQLDHIPNYVIKVILYHFYNNINASLAPAKVSKRFFKISQEVHSASQLKLYKRKSIPSYLYDSTKSSEYSIFHMGIPLHTNLNQLGYYPNPMETFQNLKTLDCSLQEITFSQMNSVNRWPLEKLVLYTISNVPLEESSFALLKKTGYIQRVNWSPPGLPNLNYPLFSMFFRELIENNSQSLDVIEIQLKRGSLNFNQSGLLDTIEVIRQYELSDKYHFRLVVTIDSSLSTLQNSDSVRQLLLICNMLKLRAFEKQQIYQLSFDNLTHLTIACSIDFKDIILSAPNLTSLTLITRSETPSYAINESIPNKHKIQKFCIKTAVSVDDYLPLHKQSTTFVQMVFDAIKLKLPNIQEFGYHLFVPKSSCQFISLLSNENWKKINIYHFTITDPFNPIYFYNPLYKILHK
ncbi:hypothetical protein DLAC_05137 [Tieghemostelium lacteum]|uniref:Uncharacterized protein n=1 Tax=Tieghemostelium lacteum TaxID=361077 RepID=A0A151ZIK9_TIELA|nr:hypothetical protein DLAC_05137 [Tieghemostelium lacteum]|eukprot:KYQ93747.1 hypothetical protein DLAC_05137 [Tieghemostelium lacteum]